MKNVQESHDQQSSQIVLDIMNSRSPAAIDDLVLDNINGELFAEIKRVNHDFINANYLKDGWNIHPKLPLKVFVVDGSPEEIDPDYGIMKDFGFAWSNFLNYFSSQFFFHPELKMQIPREHLHQVLATNYLTTSDFDSLEKLGERLERHFWAVINSPKTWTLLDSDKEIQFFLFLLSQITSVYTKLKRYEEARRLIDFSLNLGEHKGLLYESGINLIMIGEREQGHLFLDRCCSLYRKEDSETPQDILYNYLCNCFFLNKKSEAEKLFKNHYKAFDFEKSWARVSTNLSLGSSLNEKQRSALTSLLLMIIKLNPEPDRSIKQLRVKEFYTIFQMEWEEINSSHDLNSLDNKEESYETLMSRISDGEEFIGFSSLSSDLKLTLFNLIRIFIYPLKENGMIVDAQGMEASLLVVFSIVADLPCKKEYTRAIFSDSINFDAFYLYWDIVKPN